LSKNSSHFYIWALNTVTGETSEKNTLGNQGVDRRMYEMNLRAVGFEDVLCIGIGSDNRLF
jgi:hypothetical protein